MSMRQIRSQMWSWFLSKYLQKLLCCIVCFFRGITAWKMFTLQYGRQYANTDNRKQHCYKHREQLWCQITSWTTFFFSCSRNRHHSLVQRAPLSFIQVCRFYSWANYFPDCRVFHKQRLIVLRCSEDLIRELPQDVQRGFLWHPVLWSQSISVLKHEKTLPPALNQENLRVFEVFFTWQTDGIEIKNLFQLSMRNNCLVAFCEEVITAFLSCTEYNQKNFVNAKFSKIWHVKMAASTNLIKK